MKNVTQYLFGLVFIALLSGCNLATNSVIEDVGSKPVNAVVVDLDAVSKATGQDDILNNQMKAVNADLTLQLGNIVTDFNKQLANHKKKFGADISVDEQQKLQEMLIKANQLLAQKQAEANAKAKQHKEGLIKTWRDKIQPLVKEVAGKKGASVVLVQSAAVMWFDSTIDITDEVIAALRKKPVSNSGNGNKVEIPVGSGDVI